MEENLPKENLIVENIPVEKGSEEYSKKPIKIIIFGAIFVILVSAVGAGAYYLGSQKQTLPQRQTLQTVKENVTKEEQETLLSGKVKEIKQNLGVVALDNVKYFEAGVFTKGKNKGYTRYISVEIPEGPGGPMIRVFASKDGTNFLANGNPAKTKEYRADDYRNPLYGLNQQKIIGVEDLDTQHPRTIKLNNQFALYRVDLKTYSPKTGKDKEGYDTFGESTLLTNFNSLYELKSPTNKLQFFSEVPEINSQYQGAEYNYLNGSTEIIVVDSTGLAYSYSLTNPKSADSYLSKLAEYEIKYKEFEKAIEEYNSKIFTKNGQSVTVIPTPVFPKPPDYVSTPNLELFKNEINSNENLFNKYAIAFPGACGMEAYTKVVKNLTESDFEKIGTSLEGDIYVLKDKGHLLYQGEYNVKTFQNYQTDEEERKKLFKDMNKIDIPSFETYVSKNPLIFLKDFWGRWIVLGEYEYHIVGGCGKPVVYLYPEKSTEVSVAFAAPVKFDVSIPNYVNGWKVLANPKGELTDLQPNLTLCSLIDSIRKGSEYAKEACEKNSFPYLYWAGQSFAGAYPTQTKGWIVEKAKIDDFLNSKLDEIGFNDKEKEDFLSYWLPYLVSKNGRYYRISFLQTPEVNKIFPMNVSPAPKSIYRYFMDWNILDQIPEQNMEPQKLEKIQRNGFTLVEWGGLK